MFRFTPITIAAFAITLIAAYFYASTGYHRVQARKEAKLARAEITRIATVDIARLNFDGE